MSLKEYVIGGMDRSFKQKLHHALRQMDDAGLMPGITSAFRDDYRQAIASGHKASSDSSYHGGSRRGGYGHGLAIDLVSVRGDTRGQRYRSTEELWKWVDVHERELKVGRPYLSRDPPHVGPIDGKEFVAKRGGRGAASAVAEAKQTKQKAAQAKKEAKRKATLAGRHKSAPPAKQDAKQKLASAKAQAKVTSAKEQATPKAAAKHEAKPKVTAPAKPQAKPKVAAPAKQDAKAKVAVQVKQQPKPKAAPLPKQKVAVQPKKQAGSAVTDRHSKVSSL